MKILLVFLSLLLVALVLLFWKRDRIDVPPMSGFDLSKYMGKWYEIARTDTSFERGLEQVFAEYQPDGKGGVSVTNRGYSPEKGEWHEAHARAVATDTPGHFKVYFVPLLAGNYQIAYVDSDYTLALVSGGTPDYLWILSRTPSISPEARERMLSRARDLGYDTGKLIFTRQNENSASPPSVRISG